MISILPLALVSIFSSPALFATMFRPFEGFLEVTEMKTKQSCCILFTFHIMVYLFILKSYCYYCKQPSIWISNCLRAHFHKKSWIFSFFRIKVTKINIGILWRHGRDHWAKKIFCSVVSTHLVESCFCRRHAGSLLLFCIWYE